MNDDDFSSSEDESNLPKTQDYTDDEAKVTKEKRRPDEERLQRTKKEKRSTENQRSNIFRQIENERMQNIDNKSQETSSEFSQQEKRNAEQKYERSNIKEKAAESTRGRHDSSSSIEEERKESITRPTRCDRHTDYSEKSRKPARDSPVSQTSPERNFIERESSQPTSSLYDHDRHNHMQDYQQNVYQTQQAFDHSPNPQQIYQGYLQQQDYNQQRGYSQQQDYNQQRGYSQQQDYNQQRGQQGPYDQFTSSQHSLYQPNLSYQQAPQSYPQQQDGYGQQNCIRCSSYGQPLPPQIFHPRQQGQMISRIHNSGSNRGFENSNYQESIDDYPPPNLSNREYRPEVERLPPNRPYTSNNPEKEFEVAVGIMAQEARYVPSTINDEKERFMILISHHIGAFHDNETKRGWTWMKNYYKFKFKYTPKQIFQSERWWEEVEKLNPSIRANPTQKDLIFSYVKKH